MAYLSGLAGSAVSTRLGRVCPGSPRRQSGMRRPAAPSPGALVFAVVEEEAVPLRAVRSPGRQDKGEATTSPGLLGLPELQVCEST